MDIRLRENASYIIFCEKWVKEKGMWSIAVECKDYPDGTPTVIRQEVVNMGSEKVRKMWFYANDYFDLYDTKEIIHKQKIQVDE